MSSKRPDPTMKSTQEQLRSDHIGTLELLQQCTKENVQLKKELKMLRANGQNTDAHGTIKLTGEDTANADLLELIEQNAKQADEIKLLKARLNQAELDTMKSKQIQASSQNSMLQSLADKAKKKEMEMEKAVFDLENHLRTANSELEAYSGIETLLHNLRSENSEFVRKFHDLEHNYCEVRSLNENLTITKCELDRQLSSLQRELDLSQQDNKRLEGSSDQRLLDSQKLLTHQIEQNGILKKELSSQAEMAFQLQRTNETVIAERDAALLTNKNLQSSIGDLNNVIAECRQSILELQRAEDEDVGETFKFTAPEQLAPTSIPTAPITVPVVDATKPDSEESESSFRFQEFLRLKRENKELKMRLADMGHAGSAPYQPETLAVSSRVVTHGSGPPSSSPRASTKKLVGGGLPARTRNSTSQKVL